MDSKKKWGGERAGAGRKPSPVPKVKLRISVPAKYEQQIKEKFQKITKAYEERCMKEIQL